MSSQTAGKNLPYPLGTDRVMDGDDAIRRLAQSVDNMIQMAQLTIPITAAQTAASVTWTFPIAFAAGPMVFTQLLLAGPLSRGVSVSVLSTNPTQAVINGWANSGTASVSIYALAIGPVVAVS
jgi:hypothetical protein